MRNIDLKNGKEIFEGFIVNNITIKDIEFDEEKFNNLIVDELTREDLFNIVLAYRKELYRKEQEHKETQKALGKCWIENGRLKKECEELKKNYFTVIQQRNKAEQTLTEIKEFVENEMIPNCDTSIILQKINKCEGDNEPTL